MRYSWPFIPISTFLCCLKAAASPAVGDFAQYSVATTQNGQTTTSTETILIVGFNPATGQYQEKVTIAPGQAPAQTTTSWVPSSAFSYSPPFSTAIAGTCQMSGGELQTVVTPAGAFGACGLPLANTGTLWVGHVPLGVVKSTRVTPSGQVTTSLINYGFGQ